VPPVTNLSASSKPCWALVWAGWSAVSAPGRLPGLRVDLDPDELAAARNHRKPPTGPGLWAWREAVQLLLDATQLLSEAAEFPDHVLFARLAEISERRLHVRCAPFKSVEPSRGFPPVRLTGISTERSSDRHRLLGAHLGGCSWRDRRSHRAGRARGLRAGREVSVDGQGFP
jgi:hypothetical protein